MAAKKRTFYGVFVMAAKKTEFLWRKKGQNFCQKYKIQILYG